MSHASPIPKTIPFRTLERITGAALGLIAVLVIIGAVSAFLAVGDPGRFWQALHFNWLFWSATSLGMVMLAVAWQTVEAEWSWSVSRFALAGVAFLPISFILLLVILFGGHETLFSHWLHSQGDPVIEAKRAWLNLGGLRIRDILAVAVLYGGVLYFAYLSLRPDVYGAGRTEGQRSLYARLTGGWRGTAEEATRSRRILLFMGPILGLLYAVLWGIIAIDLAMSLMPHWFSTMFPVAFFMAGFHAGIAMTALMVTFFRPRLGLEPYVTGSQYHDLGKMLFAFGVFWMYLNWSQYVVIWYGLLPWEQEWFVKRFEEPYATLSGMVPLLIFVIPFFGLLTRPPKRVPGIVGFFAVIILVGNWLERYLLIYPSLHAEGNHELPFGIPEIGIGLGFLGLFLLSYLWFIKTFPVLPSPATLAARPPTVVPAPLATRVHHDIA